MALLPEGYDQDSKILTTGQGTYANEMTATEAVEFLSDLLKDFPFADEGNSKAVAIAAMLTLYGLNLMPPRTLLPVILFRANCPGAGKGLLAQLATLLVLGYTPTGVDPKSETEMRKHSAWPSPSPASRSSCWTTRRDASPAAAWNRSSRRPA